MSYDKAILEVARYPSIVRLLDLSTHKFFCREFSGDILDAVFGSIFCCRIFMSRSLRFDH